MIIKQNEGTDYVQPKAGLTNGVITSFVDVGTSDDKYNPGKTKREVMIVVTLPKQHNIPDDGTPPEMLTISKWFTASMHEKSNLYAFVSSLMTVDSDLDLNALLGLNLMVHITERTNDNGDKRMSINSVAPLMDGEETIELPTSKFDFDNFVKEEFDALSEKMQARLKLTPEYKASGMPF